MDWRGPSAFPSSMAEETSAAFQAGKPLYEMKLKSYVTFVHPRDTERLIALSAHGWVPNEAHWNYAACKAAIDSNSVKDA